MSSTYDDTVFDFDLNFLNQTTTNTEQDAQTKNEKLRRSVIFLKKKVLFSHKAVNRYKIARKYANILESNQVFNKEGCKQHLIEIRSLIENVARLENECRAAETREKEKSEIIYDLQNKLEALQSHEKQLKLLLKEKNKLEPVRVEKNKPIFKDRVRKGLLEKENDALNKEIERLKKDIETLRRGDPKIIHLENENETNCKENSKILNLEKEIQNLLKEIDEAKNLKKANEYLRKENAKIPNLDKENETLRKETAKIPNLEKENKILRKENAKIQSLEKVIASLRKENAKIVYLEKVNGNLHKENAKIRNLEKEIKMLTENLDLVKKEKSKLRLKCNQLLRKYESLPDGKGDWSDNSDTENYLFEDVFLPPAATNPVMVKKSEISSKDILPLDFDNDNSNEVVSIDTGRGSSLAYSDNEKCLHSPDYFENDSLLNEENIENKEKSDVNMKSEILFEDTVETATNLIVYIEEDCSNIESLDNREMNPELPTIERLVSPIKETREVATGPVRVSDDIPPQKVQDMQTKKCLELNNSINLQCEPHTDLEIEKILSRMQLNYHAVSPIPRTPATLPVLESGLGEDTKMFKMLGKIEILAEELTELRKAMNEEIEERLRQSNQRLTLQSDNLSSASRFDGDHYHDRNMLKQSENALRTQISFIDDPIVNNYNSKLSNVISEDNNAAILLNRVSKETDILQSNKPEYMSSQMSLSDLRHQNPKQLPSQDHHVSEELTTDKEISKNTDTDICPTHNKDLIQLTNNDATNGRKSKSRKITKLGKLKKKLEPKYKIRRETPPLRSRIKPKQLEVVKKKVSEDVSSELLNDKNVYENAVKVMAEIHSQQNNKVAKSSPKHIQVPRSPKAAANLEKQNNTIDLNQVLLQNDTITTRSKRKCAELLDNCAVIKSKEPLVNLSASITDISENIKDKEDIETADEHPSRKRRRHSINKSEIQCKRILRSSTAQLRLSTEDNTELLDQGDESNTKLIECHNASELKIPDVQLPITGVSTHDNGQRCERLDQDHNNVISYDDLNVFLEDKVTSGPVKETNKQSSCHPKESILCSMIEKYGVETVRSCAKKVPDIKVKFVCEKLEQEITKIIEVPTNETKTAMNTLVADLRKLNYKHFITGLMKYLTKPERKSELFGKVNSPPAPPMTKAEQILLYVISHLKTHWPSVDIVDAVLSNIEYTIFKLNRTPEFDVIESTSHFYALLCRYFGAKSRLRLFILDAMYCIQFKSLPLIMQCLDVWMHIIPLAHMGIAKSPLVTCMVYLLHFYKCDDKFNRIQDLRNILHRKYFYRITDWNEKKILEMFRISIMELTDIPVERKMLRLALIILAKRHGPRWCQNNIIKNLLQPMLEKENVPNNVKEFCVSMFGPLLRPYPVDMKVHCEIVINQLGDILNNEPSRGMEEAAITSMMFINRHDQLRINQTLLLRRMKTMSPELEKLLRDYVRTKPLKMWKKTLTKMTRF